MAKEFDLCLLDLRLSQCDPTDLLGFPRVLGEKAGYVPMDTFPIRGDELPIKVNEDGVVLKDSQGNVLRYKGWLLFLDELPLASQEVQKAAYKLILDRMVGNHHIHKNVAMVAAGNLETDGALVEPMSQALKSRMIHLEVMADFGEWKDYALSINTDFRIISYLEHRKEAFYNFRGDLEEYTYASPRTWMTVNDLITDPTTKQGIKISTNDHILKALIAGSVGEGIGPEFMTFCELEKDIPTLADIIKDPENIKMPEKIDVLWLLAGMLGKEITEANLEAVGKYVKRMPIEFQVSTLRFAVKRNIKLMNNPTILKWIAETTTKMSS